LVGGFAVSQKMAPNQIVAARAKQFLEFCSNFGALFSSALACFAFLIPATL
jgi:hypothetical protein